MSNNNLPLTIQRPQRDAAKTPARTIDLFYEQAYQTTTSSKIPFYIILLSLGIANSGDATEISAINFLLGNEEFKSDILKDDLKVRGSMLASSVFFGMLLGGLVTGAFGDKIGRRPILLIGLALNSICGILAACAVNVTFLCFLRFGCGLGIGAIISSQVTLVIETCPPSRRGFFSTLVASFWSFGSIYVAIMAKIVFDYYDATWRLFMICAALPIVLGTVMVYLYVPESARYLALVNQHQEATKVANRVADSMGFRGAKLEEEEILEYFPSSQLTKKEESIKETTFNAFWNLSLIYQRDLMVRTLVLQFIMFCVAFGNGLSIWINTLFVELEIDDVYMHLIYFSIANLPGNIVAALCLELLGRKVLLILGLVFSSLSLVVFAQIATHDQPNTTHVTLCACFFHAFIVVVFSTVFVLASELYPTSLRSTGLGMATASARLAAMMVQYFYGSLIDESPHMILISSGLALLCGAIGVCFIGVQDMTNRPLSDSVSECSSVNINRMSEVIDVEGMRKNMTSSQVV